MGAEAAGDPPLSGVGDRLGARLYFRRRAGCSRIMLASPVLRRLVILVLFAVAGAPGCTEADARTVVLEVDGMHCEGCVGAIGDGLRELEGVRKVEVSLDDGRATAQVGLGVNPDELEAVIEGLGYQATVLSVANSP